ncbi:MAG: hypothetical protein KGL13_03865 [Gammaproteobacteria bacterium]|nr:hypothetical protein [Gammaproteobacteria bacterium]MDE2345585.1 hypothetical protein [Gammaproteobacteria bacterium]
MTRLHASVLDGVANDLSSLQRAVQLQQRAAGVGFDWQQLAPVLAKIREELDELEHEIVAAADSSRQMDELGDLLFAVANLARKLGVDPDEALASTNLKFIRRFQTVERELAAQGRSPAGATLEEMDAIWERSKSSEP